jgi:hypothetical protein
VVDAYVLNSRYSSAQLLATGALPVIQDLLAQHASLRRHGVNTRTTHARIPMWIFHHHHHHHYHHHHHHYKIIMIVFTVYSYANPMNGTRIITYLAIRFPKTYDIPYLDPSPVVSHHRHRHWQCRLLDFLATVI